MGGGDLSGGEKRTADELTAVVLRGSRYRQSACVSCPCVRVEKKNRGPVPVLHAAWAPPLRGPFHLQRLSDPFPRLQLFFPPTLVVIHWVPTVPFTARVSSSLLDWGLSVVGDMKIKLHAKVFLVLIFEPQLLLGF
jgi:hypothetical protein